MAFVLAPSSPYILIKLLLRREPLCKFLDVPVPDAPFPKGNSHATFEERRTALLSQRMGASLTWVGYAGLSAVAAAGLLKASKYLKM